MLFYAIIENFQIVPYVRMTRRGKWISKQAKRYLSNQEQLAWIFKQDWGSKPPIDCPVAISFSVHVSHNRQIDSDNVDKALRDALQKAGVIKNDRLIIGTNITRLWHDGIDRVVVQLEKVNSIRKSSQPKL